VNQVRDVRRSRPDELAVADEIGAAVRSDRTTTRPSEKGKRDHETDDRHERLR
jgi:hypothetical protein